MSIPSNYQSLSGFRTAYTETELRLAIAIAEAFIENDLGSGGGGGGVTSEVIVTDGTDDLAINADGSLNASVSGVGAPSDSVAISDTGSNSLVSLFKRLLSVTLSNTNTSLGNIADVAATSDTQNTGLIGLTKRLLTRLTTLLPQVGGRLAVDASGTITSVGNVAAAATDSGNPVKVGGVYNTARPTYTNGQRGNIEISARGGILADFEDYVTNPNNINTVDAGSSTVSGANSQNIITGTPTNNSTVSALFSGNSSFAVLISGTWVGTLQFERTLDGGTTWTSVGAFSAGTNFITQTTTANGAFHGNSSSSNGIRVRATAWTSGVASVRILLGQGTGTITIGNPIRLFDSVNNTQATIRGSSSAPAAPDTAIVTSPRIETISPTLFQITLTNANTEYSQAITSAKKISFKVLSGGDIRYAYVTGRVATPTSPYYTLNSLSEESEDFPGNDRFTGTLYLASATAGTIVIAKVWG